MKSRALPLGRVILGLLALVAVGRLASRAFATAAVPVPADEVCREAISSESASSTSPSLRTTGRCEPAVRVASELSRETVALADESFSRETDRARSAHVAPAHVARLLACVTRLATALGDEAALDPAAREIARAARSLGRPGLDALVSLVADGRASEDTRALACALLEVLRDRDPAAVAALAAATQGSEPRALRRAAARALARCAPEQVEGRLVTLSNDPDALVALAGLEGLARAGDPAALALLEETASLEGAGNTRAAALGALDAVESDASRAALERCRVRVPVAARPAVSLLLARRGSRSPEVLADVRAAAGDEKHPERRRLAGAVLSTPGE